MSRGVTADPTHWVWVYLANLAARCLPSVHRWEILGDLEEEFGPLDRSRRPFNRLTQVLRISVRFHFADLSEPALRWAALKSTILFLCMVYTLTVSASITFGHTDHPIATLSLTPGIAMSWLVASGCAAFLLGRAGARGPTIGLIGTVWLAVVQMIPLSTGFETVAPVVCLMFVGLAVGATCGRTSVPIGDNVDHLEDGSDYHV